MYLIERYIIAEIGRLLMTIVIFLVFMFACYSSQRYLTEAANGTLALSVVFDVVFYKVIIALEMLLPIGLYVSIAVALGQLYNDSEIIALFCSGASPTKIYNSVLVLALPLGIFVTVLSLYGRPWAYEKIYQLEQQSQSELNVSHLQENKFNTSDDGRMVLASRIKKDDNNLADALIYTTSGGNTSVYRAHSAGVIDPSPSNPSVMLRSGTLYVLDRTGTYDKRQTFNNLKMALKPIIQDIEVRRKAASVSVLARSSDPSDTAELQWRQSRGITAILMAFLAIFLSKIKPRQGRFSTLLPLTIMFTAIYYGGNLTRTLVSNSSLPAMPGLWMIPLIMLIVVLLFIAHELFLLKRFFR
ncbi:LPS export ABC transporter permease LptF [Pantoea piersonii]|uniref:LPS export ABC transporter permease LptF n=1 Tax=Pantoea piersonii TaxID=2364647 RepID=UPI0028A000EB|nr:LPS export ABC transporter permease LptF [Pantoea piersonii]